MLEPTEIRFRCLDLATRTPGDVVKNAQAFYDFVITNESEPTDTHKPTATEEALPRPAEAPKAATEIVAETLEAPQEDATQTDAAEAVTYDQVQRAVLTLAKAKGRDAVLDVFKAFGVDHATKLTSDQWPDALVNLQYATA